MKKTGFPLFPLLPLYCIEHLANISLSTKKTLKPTPTTTQQQSKSAVKNTKDFGNYDVIMRDDAIGKIKMPLLIIICWPYLGRRHSVKNNVRNMAIIYLIQRNINVV